MKQCPQCGTTYTDETLRYCLSDGTALLDTAAEQATVVRPGAMRVNLGTEPQINQPTNAYPNQTVPSARGGGSGIWKVVVVILVLLLLLLVVVVAAALIYINSGRGGGANNSTPRPTPTTMPPGTPDTRDQEISNLQRQLANRQTANTNTTASGSTSISNPRTVHANSPTDGFLALRSQPSTETGIRILKIPHGAALTIGDCLPQNGRGRWCKAVYGGYSGWIYDSYVIY
ncbi:MAG: hypothetical protein JO053_15920 [Acidobacteria bacterium]|nr:hypothetical protein [Acidobacteriota bacterium]